MHSRSRDRGFALLITITLLAFLVLLLVSLSSLTRVETQVASNGQQLAQARQNALFALNVALGQLQTTAGPDQRVTACAEVLPTTNATNAKWTGVWDSNITDLAGTTTPPAPWQSLGLAKPVWLVSQANSTVNAADITQAITLPAGSYGNTTYVEMVGTGSVGTSAPTGSTVVVPVTPITIAANQVPGLSGTANATIGRFGYWVGDEGVKARINLPNPNATKTDTLSLLNQLGTAQSSAWNLFSGSTSPTPAATDPATVISTAMLNASGQMLGAGQLPLLASADGSAPAGAAAALTQIGTSRFHDYTLWSAGVQADVRDGGLKWDLSTAFDMSDALFSSSEFSGKASQLRDPSTNAIISPVKAYAAPSGVTAPTVAFAFLPPVTYTNAGTTTTSYLRGPTWSLLRSHYLLYKSQSPTATPTAINARSIYPAGPTAGLATQNAIPSLYEINSGYGGGATDPNTNINIPASSPVLLVPRPVQTSLVPYINRVFVRFGVKTVAKTVNVAGGTPTTVWAVQMVMSPIVVLHNPYNTTINFKNYSGAPPTSPAIGTTTPIAAQINLFAGTGYGLPLLVHVIVNGTQDYMAALKSSGGAALIALGANSYNGYPRFKLLIPATISLAPGEIKVLYPQTNASNGDLPIQASPTDTTYVLLSATKNLTGGFIFPLLNGAIGTTNLPVQNLGAAATPGLNPPWVSTVTLAQAAGETAITSTEYNNNSTAVAAANAIAATNHTTPPGACAEIWANNATDPIQVIMNPTGSDFEIKYSIESQAGDNAISGDGGSSLTYQLDAATPSYQAPGTSPSGTDTNLDRYTNYSTAVYPAFTRADDYLRPSTANAPVASGCSSTQYFFGLDFYAKAADQSSDRAVRPFITSNPVAFEQFSTALGGQGTGNGTNGFPEIMPSYALSFTAINPATSTDLSDNLYTTSNGDGIWGPHNGNDGQAPSTLDGGYSGLSTLPLINLPSRPLASIADFQNANIAFYGYQPYFAVGNSYASPYIPTSSFLNPVGYSSGVANTKSDTTKPYFLYDLSYLMNWSLWDKYYFSTLSQQWSGTVWNTGDPNLLTTIQSWAGGTLTLPGSRMVPYNSSQKTAASNLAPNTTAATLQADYRKVAASLMTLGSFNINSHSIDAWAAVLGAARGLSVIENSGSSLATTHTPGGTTANARTPIPRVLPANAQSDNLPLSQNTWTGFAALSDAQIRQLAANIVAEITRRQGTNGITTMTGVANPATVTYNKNTGGPFRSLADFVNRNLAADLGTPTSPAAHPTGGTGVIQAALDESTNPNSPNYSFFHGSSYQDVSIAQNTSYWQFIWNGVNNSLAGAGPTTSTAEGFLLQADVLQQIGPFLSARSDTFTIRAYGECVNPVTGVSTGKAWCEAVVQRLPEYIDQTDTALTGTSSSANGSLLGVALGDATPLYGSTGTALLNLNNQTYGRRFKIVGFRWLSPSDL